MVLLDVKGSNDVPQGVEVVVQGKPVTGMGPNVAMRSRARVRALASTGFAFGDVNETEEQMLRLTEIKNEDELASGEINYTVLVDTPF